MTRPTAAILLSVLVFPGAGHLYLKRYARGIVLIALSLVCRGFLANQMPQQASSVLAQLMSEGDVVDAGRLADLVAQTPSGSGSFAVTTASRVLAGCWVIAIVDACRIARSLQDRKVLPRHPARP